ncbi:glycosyltransferase family 2 protein [Nocardioides sp.]|uniref:glycosyltransferase family 2 protein n=1 Tax=Nocardioides sp. TaxID=35761 RepID=UPI002628A03B|nr:glycosyltransferase family 2 protein [Nocardioides sp.]
MGLDNALHFETPAEASRTRAEPWLRRIHPLLRRVRTAYLALPRRTQMIVDISLHLLLPFVIGFAIYVPLAMFDPAILSAWYVVLVLSLLSTALVISMECAHALRFPEPPLAAPPAADRLPVIGVVIAAHLVNEADTIMESLHHHLSVDYPVGKLIVVCSYNSAERLPVEAELTRLAAEDPRFVALRVEGSRSKAENINAALDYLTDCVDIIGFFDADHHPHPSVPLRAVRWLADEAGERRVDVVQGQCLIRNQGDSGVAATVAAEFATMYAVSHPGRTSLNGFGIFGGSNGFWRSEVIEAIGMDPEMLTEDIDATSRALLAGYRIGTDPGMVSTELAPQTWTALWRQRMRWAQGWWEVTQRHTVALLRSKHLSLQQKRGVGVLYVWRVLHPWLAAQMWPLIIALLLFRSTTGHAYSWGVPIFVLTTLVTLGTPILQAAIARRLSPPLLRDQRRLFVRFGFLSMLFYAEFKAIINRAAIVRDLFGMHEWNVTPRSRHTEVRREHTAHGSDDRAVA